MPPRVHFDVAIVGSGPAGSSSALTLARGGARVALIDRSLFPRDKACGDVVGPKGVSALRGMGLTPPPGRSVADMDIIFPNGRRMRLPSEPGLNVAGEGLSIKRSVFDEFMHDAALEAGATPFLGRADSFELHNDGRYRVTISNGELHQTVTSRYVIGADGSNSRVASSFGLVNQEEQLLGFAVRTYVKGTVSAPLISILADDDGLFPGYGWAFPGEEGRLNVGIGVGLMSDRKGSSRAVRGLTGYLEKLMKDGLIDSPGGDEEGGRLGGWLNMAMSGTSPARGRVLLVGDAAGLVNPLQGEGIAQALDSGREAARAVLSCTHDPSPAYIEYLRGREIPFQSATAMVHRLALDHPYASERVMTLLSVAPVQRFTASAWGIYWNNLTELVGPIKGQRRSIIAGSIISALSKAR